MTITQGVNVDALVEELREAGLPQEHAWRAAFCAVTYQQGWSPGRIGRYLGISRNRVSQKIEKLQDYVDTKDMPFLRDLLESARPAAPSFDIPVAFPSAAWTDAEFALGLLRLVAA